MVIIIHAFGTDGHNVGCMCCEWRPHSTLELCTNLCRPS